MPQVNSCSWLYFSFEMFSLMFLYFLISYFHLLFSLINKKKLYNFNYKFFLI